MRQFDEQVLQSHPVGVGAGCQEKLKSCSYIHFFIVVIMKVFKINAKRPWAFVVVCLYK